MNEKKTYKIVFVGSMLYLTFLTLFTLYMNFYVGCMSDELRVLLISYFISFAFITVIFKMKLDSC